MILSSSYGQTPFDCSSVFYQVISGDLRPYNVVTGQYGSPINSLGQDYNSTGYNIEDDFIYGIQSSGENVLRMGSAGVIVDLGVPTEVGGGVTAYEGSFAGEMDDDGNFWTRVSATEFHKVIDVTNGVNGSLEFEVINITGSGNTVADIVFINNHFYGVRATTLYDWDISLGTVSSRSVTGLSGGNGFGAAFTDDQDRLYVANNSGGLFLIEDYTTANPAGFRLNSTEATNSNDGAACPLAPSPIDQDSDSI